MEQNFTGADLILLERAEQIYKHGFTTENDARYKNNELVKAALFCIAPELYEWPTGWNTHFKYKIMNKSREERLIISGAFIAAEYDRVKHNAKVVPITDEQDKEAWETMSKIKKDLYGGNSNL